jgi:preprotein translocase subunit SecE
MSGKAGEDVKVAGGGDWFRRIGDFVRETRTEVAKVTWPTRKETLVTTAMVVAMSILAAIFFFLVDYLLSTGVRFILGA